jgi:hypothetical protein
MSGLESNVIPMQLDDAAVLALSWSGLVKAVETSERREYAGNQAASTAFENWKNARYGVERGMNGDLGCLSSSSSSGISSDESSDDEASWNFRSNMYRGSEFKSEVESARLLWLIKPQMRTAASFRKAVLHYLQQATQATKQLLVSSDLGESFHSVRTPRPWSLIELEAMLADPQAGGVCLKDDLVEQMEHNGMLGRAVLKQIGKGEEGANKRNKKFGRVVKQYKLKSGNLRYEVQWYNMSRDIDRNLTQGQLEDLLLPVETKIKPWAPNFKTGFL